jgi:preprotein translocase subunit SecY
MISAFTNSFKIPELRNRILFTLAMLVVFRIGAAITCPGVNGAVIQAWFDSKRGESGGSVAALFNIFSGGALENCALLSLGVMPYISASIMLQLLTAVVPQLGKIAKEDGGRQKIMQYTRYATIALCIIQGYMLALTFEHPQNNPLLHGIMDTINKMGPLVAEPGVGFRAMTVLALTAGTMFLMWIGDQITDRGVGNGMSMIIAAGIVARLPAAMTQAWNTFVPTAGKPSDVSPIILVFMIAFLVLVIAGVICVTQAQRKVSVQYAKRVVGRKVYGGQTQYMPLKVNYAGVMPIIFAQAILFFPSTIVNMAFPTSQSAQLVAQALTRGWVHNLLYGAMIFFFSYFWVATQFQPQQIADDLKKYGGYIPGVRPGKATADFLDFTMTRLTFAGAIFLTVIAILPSMLAESMKVPYIAAQFFGGTSLLIVVGVVLDTMRQVETHLIQRHYDGFLRKGRVRGRDRTPTGLGEAVGQNTLVWLYAVIAVLLVAGLAVFIAGRFK